MSLCVCARCITARADGRIEARQNISGFTDYTVSLTTTRLLSFFFSRAISSRPVVDFARESLQSRHARTQDKSTSCLSLRNTRFFPSDAKACLAFLVLRRLCFCAIYDRCSFFSVNSTRIRLFDYSKALNFYLD